MIEHRAAEIAGKTADTLTTATKITAGSTLIAGITIEQWTTICGLIAVLIGILGTIIVTSATVYYRRKEYKLKEMRAKHGDTDDDI